MEKQVPSTAYEKAVANEIPMAMLRMGDYYLYDYDSLNESEKAFASEDNELLRVFMDYRPFETNKGVRSFGSIRSADNVILSLIHIFPAIEERAAIHQ